MATAPSARETKYIHGFERISPQPGDSVLVLYGPAAYEATARLTYGRYVERVGIPAGCGPENDEGLIPYFRRLKLRAVVIWPQAGEEGRANALRHARLIAEAGAASVGLVSPPLRPSTRDADDRFDAFNLGDGLPEGVTPRDLAALVIAALVEASARALPVRSTAAPRATRAVPPAAGPVDGAALLARIRAFLDARLAEPQSTIDTIALWCLHAWIHDNFDVSPRLVLHGLDPRAAHARALRLAALLTPTPIVVSRTIATHLLPAIAEDRPTLLLDDVGGTMLTYVDMRALIAAGAARDGAFLGPRTRRNLSGWLSCFTPTALATCARLPDDTRARAIVVPMLPPARDATRAMFPLSDQPPEVVALRADMQRWAKDLDPARLTPDTIPHENWRPLFAIAQAIGEDAACAATIAAHDLAEAAEPAASPIELLRDIRNLIRIAPEARIPSHEILAKLTADAEGPWTTAMHGRKLNANGLAERLRRFAVRPRLLRMDNGAIIRGYHGDELTQAFARYLDDTNAEQDDARSA